MFWARLRPGFVYVTTSTINDRCVTPSLTSWSTPQEGRHFFVWTGHEQASGLKPFLADEVELLMRARAELRAEGVTCMHMATCAHMLMCSGSQAWRDEVEWRTRRLVGVAE